MGTTTPAAGNGTSQVAPTAFVDLADKTTVDLVGVNDPLRQALAAKLDVATSQLGAMGPAVQALIDAAVQQVRDRAQQTGNMPAANAVLGSGQTVEQAVAQLRQSIVSPSAPVITTAPTISGTAAVGSTLTVTSGTVTEGIGGSHTSLWQWYTVDGDANLIAINGATTSTLVVIAAMLGKRILCVQIAVDSTGLISASRASAVTSAVSATLPANTAKPTITPSDTQPIGTTYSFSNPGSWENDSGAAVAYKWTLSVGGGSDVDIAGATSSTYTSIAGQEGGVIKGWMRKTTSQGASPWVDSSNSSTVSGAPAVVNLTAPAFPATLTVNVPATITNAAWSGGAPTLSLTRIYVDSATTPYAVISANPAVYTPDPDGNSFLLSQTGLTSLVGHTVYCDQQWTFNGQTIISPKSVGRVVQAPPATLAARIDSAILAWTQGTAITSVRPITGINGTAPLAYSISPALSAGLTMNTSTGFISGAPTVSSAQNTYTVTVTDAVGATGSAPFQASVAASGVTPLVLALAASPANDYVIEAPNDSDVTGYGTKHFGNNTAVVSSLSNLATISRGGVVRFGPATKSGAPAILHRVVSGDPTRNSGHRAELDYSQFTFANAEDVWFAQAVLLDPDCNPATSGGASDHFLLQQTHQENTSPAPIGNPFSLTYVGGGSSQGINWIVTYQGNDYELYRTPIVTGVWLRFITHYRSGFTASGHNPILEAWVAQGAGEYSKLAVLSPWSANQQFGDPLSTPGSGNDWAKSGIYKWTTGAYGSSNTRTFWSSGVRAGKGANLFNEAAASIAAYAL